ncbi:MAG: WD40/YVTN/BNR-like repeat-containing protein [Chloroflexota bacterium]
MKKSLLIISLFFAFLFGAFAQNPFYDNFELTRLSFCFNGAAYNGSSILAYGEAGIILRSEDGGANWEKITFNDSLSILAIYNINSNYVGISSSNHAIISSDNGKTWTTKKIDHNGKVYQGALSNDKIFLLTNNELVEVDKELEVINKISIQNKSPEKELTIVGNYAIHNSEKGELTLINTETKESEKISLKELGLCENCAYISQLKSDGQNTVYFMMENSIYGYNLTTKTAQLLNNLPKKDGIALTVNNKEPYAIYTIQQIGNLDSLYFVKYDPATKEFKNQKEDGNDHYIYKLNFRNIEFLTKDTLIAVGFNNLIYMSYNGGKNWSLKTFLGSILRINVFSKQEIRAFGAYGQFFHTNNGGVTWLPQRNYIAAISSDYKFLQPINFSGTFLYKDKLNGFMFVHSSHTADTNLIYTNDGGITVKAKYRDKIQRSGFYSFAMPYKDKTFFISSGIIPFGWWALIFKLDDEFNFEKQINVTSTQFFHAFVYDNKIYALGQDSSDADSVFAVYSSDDDGESWKKDFNFPALKPITGRLDGITIIGKDIFASFSNDIKILMKIDVVNKNAKIIYKDKKNLPLFPLLLNGKYYILKGTPSILKSASYVLLTPDIEADSIEWKKVETTRFSGPELRYSLNDTLFAFSLIDSLVGEDQLFLAKPKGNTGIADRPRREKLSEIALSGPLASSQAGEYEFNVTLDEKAIAEKMILAAYDVRGSRVGSDFLFTPGGAGQGRLLWKPGKLPPGAYVLILKCGSAVGSATVVVE